MVHFKARIDVNARMHHHFILTTSRGESNQTLLMLIKQVLLNQSELCICVACCCFWACVGRCFRKQDGGWCPQNFLHNITFVHERKDQFHIELKNCTPGRANTELYVLQWTPSVVRRKQAPQINELASFLNISKYQRLRYRHRNTRKSRRVRTTERWTTESRKTVIDCRPIAGVECVDEKEAIVASFVSLQNTRHFR
jgi:hypothetical protein